MSRITDTERGARIALDEALHVLHPDLFPDMLPQGEQDMWWSILNAARFQLAECRWSREVTAQA
jgi:hypothetical protein